MFKKANVVMLPTNEKAPIILMNMEEEPKIILRGYNLDTNYGSDIPQHLYITSNEEIKESDWCINSFDNQLWQYSKVPCPLPYWGNKETLTKIIATTNSKLSTTSRTEIPQPSPQFIQKYIEEYNKGNIITEVMVEYEANSMLKFASRLELNSTYGIRPINKTKEDLERLWEIGHTLKLKVNSKDNTITIKKIKDSWTKDEMCTNMQYYMEYVERNGYVTPTYWLDKYKHF